jgi:hypothetical protein
MSIPFPGLVIPFTQYHLLVYGPDADALGPALFGPPVHLRPGYWSLPHNDYLLPTETIDDFGQRFPAPECYEWIEARGDAFPRADAIGILRSGQQASAFMKELDLAVMAAFAAPSSQSTAFTRLDLALQALPVPDGYALTPIPPPLPLLARALPAYRLAPGAFGAAGAAILTQLLATRRTDWRLTFDDVDDLTAGL